MVGGSDREECFGVGRMACLVEDGELLYDRMDGFEHEEGHSYRLRIERYDLWPDREEPSLDSGRCGYRLLDGHVPSSGVRVRHPDVPVSAAALVSSAS